MNLRTLVPLVILLAACKKKPEPPPPPPPPPPVEMVKPVVPEIKPAELPEPVKQIARNFERVHFEFDSTALTGDSMVALRENAKILSENTGIRVEIQGHADERGTTEYNLALGERRARTLKDTLAGMGAGSAQLTVISYGEERPLQPGEGETVWAKNRRAEFRIIAGENVKGTVQ